MSSQSSFTENEALVQALFEQNVVGVAQSKIDTFRVVRINQRFCDILGYTREEMKELDWRTFTHPDDLPKNLDHLRQLREGSIRAFTMEKRYIRKDGSLAWVNLTVLPMWQPDVPPDDQLVLVEDITRRKTAEEALRESEALVHSIGNHLPNGMLYQIVRSKDSHRNFTYVSDAVWRFYGCSPEEAMADAGRIYSRVLEEDFPRVHAEEETANADFIPFSTECRMKNPDGTIRWSYFASSPRRLENGDTCWDGIEIDITERKKMQENLFNEQLLSEHMINSLPGIFYLFDENGRYLRWNRNLEIVTGKSPEEIGQASPLDFFEGTDKDLVAERIKEVYEKGSSSAEAHLVVKDGKQIPYFFTGLRIQFEGKHYLIGVGLDISERKAMEEQLLQARKMEALGRLAGGVAHDFNNMLQAILGYAELALAVSDPSGRMHDNLTLIKETAERSADLTGQLLAFARRQTANPRVLDLNEAVTGILNLLRRLIGENIELTWKPGTDLWPVKMDTAQIDQILTNLAVNARDAISGQGNLIIETGNVSLDDHCCQRHSDWKPGEYVLLEMRDSGYGMDQEILEHLFEPFFTTKEMGRGTGLGMATVYGIIKQNQGLIDVDSRPGQGTVVRVYLPRSNETLTKDQTVIETPTRSSGTILLVEDNETVLAFTETVLKMHGYTVLAARSPGEALETALSYQEPVHLLITDVVMPEMNGRALADRITPLRPGIKTLFMSGYTADIISRHGVLDPGLHFLQKPFSVSVLTNKVKEILG
ncbi:MAG: PAS domain S-box protein [Thermodesulfobacteriota bacterium]